MVAHPARPPLRRRTEDRLLAGVAGGIADWLNAPVVWIRVILVVALSWLPWGWVAYGLVALVLPAQGRRRPDWDNLVGVGRLVLLFFAADVLFASPDDDVEQLFQGQPGRWIPIFALGLVGAAAYFALPFSRAQPADPRSTVLASLPLAIFLSAVAVGLLLAPDFRWDRILPLGCVIAAIALAARVMRSGARPVVTPVVLATAVAALAVAADVRLEGGVGDRSVVAAGVEAPAPSHVAIGNLSADLSRLRPTGDPVTYRATVGMGTLRIVVPNRIGVALDARVGRGAISPPADYLSGFGVSVSGPELWIHPRRRPSDTPPPVRLRVVARVGLGKVEILRAHQVGGRY